MTSSDSIAPQVSIKKRNGVLARLFFTLLCTLAVLLVATPIAIKAGLQQWLSAQAQSDVTIAELKLNMFSGKLFLRQLNIPHQNKTQPPSSLEYASIKIDIKALFQQQIVVNEITLSHADITINQTTEQLHIAGIPVPQTAPPPADTTPTTTHSGDRLAVTIETISLESVSLNYHSAHGSSKVVVDSKIKNTKTAEPDTAIDLSLHLNINNGDIRYQGQLRPFAATPSFNGELVLNKLDLTAFASFVPQNDFIINQLTLEHQSSINGTFPSDGTPQFNLKGDATLNNIDAITVLNDNSHLKATSIAVNKIDLQYPTSASIGAVIINDLDVALHRDNQGNLLVKAPPVEDNVSVTSSNTPLKDNKKTELMFSIDSLSVEGDSTLSFSDATVTPQFNIRLAPLSLSLGSIDSAHPATKTSLSLNAHINKTAETTLTGNLSPLASDLNITLNNSLINLELPVISPYTEQAIGYQLRRGRLSAETTLEIKGEQLQATNKLTLAKLSIKEIDPEKAQGLIEQLEMPLDSALDLLRDSDDNIIFDLPINGSLNDPQFKLGGVVKLAVGKGMKIAAMKYLTSALQPIGTLLLAKDLVGVITKPRFKPLSFAAGNADLDPASSTYLNKIAELLISRPQLTISLCGIANQDDQRALSTIAPQDDKQNGTTIPREQLHTLATTRADNARSHLIQLGISEQQLFACNPAVSPERGDSESIVEGVEITL